MLIVNDFKDYKILGMSNKEKTEKWGDYTLVRPDPQIIWNNDFIPENIDAHYHRSNKGGGYWEKINQKIDKWTINYKDLTFNLKLMGFKHTGVFPEQSVNWDFMREKIKQSDKKDIKILNLFAYTGCATMACLKEGTSVVHVDSSKGMIDWAKENQKSCNLEEANVRYLVDDVVKFVQREIRRGNKYDGIVMDPPSYGRGSNNEVWDIEKDLFPLVNYCMEILSDDPIFFIINSYSANLSSPIIKNIMDLTIGKKYEGKITAQEIILQSEDGLYLPAGVCGRYEK